MIFSSRLFPDLTKYDVEELNHVSAQIRNQEPSPGVWVHVDLMQVWPPLSVGQIFPSVRIVCVQTAVSIDLKGRYLAVPITDSNQVGSGHVTRGSTIHTFSNS